MTETTRRGAIEGAAYGFIAGFILFVVEEAYSTLMGFTPMTRMFAKIFLGESAIATPMSVGALFVGLIVHLALSASYGLLYGVLNGRFALPTRTKLWSQLTLGVVAGAVV
jgi:hypothetical protein